MVPLFTWRLYIAGVSYARNDHYHFTRTDQAGVGRTWSLISKYHNRNPYSLAHLSDPKGANMSLLPFLETVSQVLLGLSLIAAIALLIGAVFDLKVSDTARSTLWGIFWAGLITGGILFFVVYANFRR